MFPQKGFCPFQILRSIDTYCFYLTDSDFDRISVFQPSQLFQRFCR